MVSWPHDDQVVLPLGDVPDKRAGRNPKQDSEVYPPGGPCVAGVTGETVCIRRKPKLEDVRRCAPYRSKFVLMGEKTVLVVLERTLISGYHPGVGKKWMHTQISVILSMLQGPSERAG